LPLGFGFGFGFAFGGLSVAPAINHCQVSFALEAAAQYPLSQPRRKLFPAHTHTHPDCIYGYIESGINLPRTCARGQKGAAPEAAAATQTQPRTWKMPGLGMEKNRESC